MDSSHTPRNTKAAKTTVPADPVTIEGQLEHITFSDPESGFTIARVKAVGHKSLLTVVGPLMEPAPGSQLYMQGYWNDHPRYGRQFRVVSVDIRAPATRKGIRKYLGSGTIKGIGPSMAERIVKRFGLETLDVLDNDIERLCEVKGIGAKRLEMIRRSWESQKDVRDVMLFLQSHDISAAYANRIYKTYGRQTIALIQRNPYRLADDIDGIGFLTADKIARQLGFKEDAVLRIRAGVLYVLRRLSDDGHVCYPYAALVDKTRDILTCTHQAVTDAIETLAKDKRIVYDDLYQQNDENFTPVKAVFLADFHYCETSISRRLLSLQGTPRPKTVLRTDQVLGWVRQSLGIDLAERQAEAVTTALSKKILIITGGPGTGKTTIVQAITRVHEKLGAKVLLAAPTGRAAKRLSQATGRSAKTIHRLLEFSPTQGGFQRNQHKPLKGDLLIIDEASMVDTLLMYHLLEAVPDTAVLILVGDVNQLPSVGPGNVLKDIIASGTFPVVTLNHIFRQAQASKIVINAHRINNGRLPRLDDQNRQAHSDFYFIEQPSPEKILDLIVTLATDRIPKRFGFDPMEEIQILTPMHRGIVGVANLNKVLQQTLNPQDVYVQRGESTLRLNDKVIQIHNNYEKDVFNGDLGRVQHIDAAEKKVTVRYDERRVDYDFTELDEIVPAYALSVHKAQGSEYPAVIIPVTTQHYVLLQRNLIYTALTRARKLAVMVGTRRALAIAVQNSGARQRFTALAQRLVGGKRM